ncbi:MAG: hypothetical protein JNL60_14975, partial [Bacteroidia bacterium]|nr:hypothetical protein [Bacteroidia bacterium]
SSITIQDAITYLLSFTALLSYIPLYFIFDRFYILYPDVAVHKLNLETNIDWFLASFKNLDVRFGYISPFVQMNCIPLFLLLLFFGILTYKWNKKAFAAFVLFVVLIIASFSNAKTADGFDWVFMPMSRMYLGIPIMLYLFLCIEKIELRKSYVIVLFIPVLFTGCKLYNIKESIVKNTQVDRWDGVLCLTLEKCLRNIDYYRKYCKSIGVNHLIISNGNWTYCIVSYGGPAVHHDYPRVEVLDGDRRYWIKNYRRSDVFNTFMLLAGTEKLEKVILPSDSFKVIRIDDYGLYLVTGNKLSKKRFAQKFPEIERLAKSK